MEAELPSRVGKIADSSSAVPRSSQTVFSKEKLPESWEEHSETNRELREKLKKVGNSSRSARARRL